MNPQTLLINKKNKTIVKSHKFKSNFQNMTEKVLKSEDEWRKQLSPNQFKVCRKKGTEPAFSGDYWNTKEPGIYQCVCCGNELFDSTSKFDSGTGWPSFYQAIDSEEITNKEDKVTELISFDY